MVWRGIVFHTCGILTDGFSAGFWKHMQYFKRNSEHSSVSTFFLHSGDAALHPDYVSTFLQSWYSRFHSRCRTRELLLEIQLSQYVLCTYRKREIEEKVSVSLADQRGKKKVQQFNPKALDILMKKFATKWHPLVYTAWHQFTSTLLMEKGSISDLKTPHFRKGKCFCAPVQYRLIFQGSEERVNLVFITPCSESARSLSYS